ncbi:MAG: hypothetical protein ABIO35_10740 [Nitrobacter sp.]
MRACYEAEIGRLGLASYERDRQHVDDRLAEYMVILYIHAAFPAEVFEQFWQEAPMPTRQHALWFLGVQLELPPEKMADNFRARAISYWDSRLAAAKASKNRNAFREESARSASFSFARESLTNGSWSRFS